MPKQDHNNLIYITTAREFNNGYNGEIDTGATIGGGGPEPKRVSVFESFRCDYPYCPDCAESMTDGEIREGLRLARNLQDAIDSGADPSVIDELADVAVQNPFVQYLVDAQARPS